MKILLAVDGSPCSDVAVEEIGRRPWPAGSSLKILNAFELTIPVSLEGWTLPVIYFDDLDQALRKQAQSIVERASEKLRATLDKSIEVETQFVQGRPHVVILDEAESWGADLIVVGSHGYGKWERFLLGSVSHSVVSHAKCSVEVIRCPSVSPAEEEKAASKRK